MKQLSSICMTLLLLFVTSFSHAESNTEKNTQLMDARVASQYIPISKSNSIELETTTFLERASIKLHPYNSNIRIFKEIINNKPALEFIKDDEKNSYQSIVTHYYANCDKQELAKGVIASYKDYFGEGKQQSYNEEPRRWERVNKGSSMRNLLVIACTLPINATSATN